MYNNFKVIDSEFSNSGERFSTFGAEVEEIIEQYELILTDIATNSITSGETYLAIMEFLNYVTELKGIISGVGTQYNKLANSFLNKIEEADADLYKSSTSGLVRDFTQEKYEHFSSCLEDTWYDLCFSNNTVDGFYGILTKICGAISWDWGATKLNECHTLLLDYLDYELANIKVIFDNSHAIDEDYGRRSGGGFRDTYETSYFATILLIEFNIIDALKTMSELIGTNGSFTVENIQNQLQSTFEKLNEYFDTAMNIYISGEQPTSSVISEFANQPWASTYFTAYSGVLSAYMSDIDTLEMANMYGFNFMDVGYGEAFTNNYQDDLVKEQLMSVIELASDQAQFSASEEKEYMDSVSLFFKYIEKFGDKWYEYLNNARGEDGKLLLDGRTTEAAAFRDIVEALGGAVVVAKYSTEVLEVIFDIAQNYTEELLIIDSLKATYSGNEQYISCLEEIEKLYSKDVVTWIEEIAERATDLYIEASFSIVAKEIPLLKTVTKSIEFVGAVTGFSTEGESLYKAAGYISLYTDTNAAYQQALLAVQEADVNSENYEELTTNLYNCFLVNKATLEKAFTYMASSKSGTEQSYYNYCLNQVSLLELGDMEEPYLMSYDEFVALNG